MLSLFPIAIVILFAVIAFCLVGSAFRNRGGRGYSNHRVERYRRGG